MMLEGFSFGCWSWSVTAARKIAATRTAQPIEIAPFAMLVDLGAVEIDRRHAARAPLHEPIIAVQTHHGVFPIDGWHRIARAMNEGVQQLPARVLTPAEAKSVRWEREGDE
jgi:hypothetical protein